MKRIGASSTAVLAVVALGLASCTSQNPSGAAGGDVSDEWRQRGPAPSALTNWQNGPFSTRQFSGNGSGFNNGTVYAPTDTSQAPYPVIVVVPGFISNNSSINWFARALASHGFITMAMNTNTPTDAPGTRGTQQLNAANWIANESQVANIASKKNWGASGWSMGGGGSMNAGKASPNIRAMVPLAGWELQGYPGNNKPTLVVACNGDTVAPPASMSSAWYNQATGDKAYLGVPGSHFCVTSYDGQIAKYGVAWFKRFLDNDTRYDSIICSNPSGIGYQFRNNCPLG